MTSVFIDFGWDDFDRIARRVVQFTEAMRDALVELVQSIYDLEPQFFDWCGRVGKRIIEDVVRDYAVRALRSGINTAINWLGDFFRQAFLA